MKKRVFLLGLLALGLFSCSEKEIADPTTNGTDNEVSGDIERNFLSVTIVPANASATRADGDEGVGEEDTNTNDPTFNEGTSDENDVKSIRFYFFDKDYKAVAVKAGGATHYDVQPDEIIPSDLGQSGGNIARTINAVIVLESKKDGDTKPVYMAAVLNYKGIDLKEDEPISKLQDEFDDFSSRTTGFIMSSSVYKGEQKIYVDENGNLSDKITKEGGQEIVAVGVYDKIQKSREAAINSPATIYVERVLAKVTAKVNIDNSIPDPTDPNGNGELYYVGYVGNQGMDYKESDFNDSEEGAALNPKNKIYVKFLGWNVTADRKNSRLVKKIDLKWKNGDEDKFTGWNESWNSSDNYRSYWAVNPETESTKNTPIDDNYNFSSFNVPINNRPGPANAHKFGGATYLQENAGALSSKKDNYIVGTDSDVINSKIIVAAQLVDATGKSLELVEWQGEVYRFGNNKQTDHSYDKTLTDYEYVLKSMASDTYLYIKNGEGDQATWTKISEDDVYIKFEQISPDNADKAYEEQYKTEKRYYVTLKLKKPDASYAIYKFDKTKSTWDLDTNNGEGYKLGTKYTIVGSNEEQDVVANAINSIGKIKHWKEGYTYYWVNIRHLADPESGGSTTGYYGVVRNHWYDYAFTSVKGLGVPVSDPNEIIYPEEPGEPDYFYLAAEVKILSWRMVYNNDTKLGW